jgi:hypothetical protein
VRQSVPATIVVLVGLLLLVNFVVINPLLAGAAAALLDIVLLLAAGAALAGGVSLLVRHGSHLVQGREDRIGSAVLLGGMLAMLAVGLYPGSAGASDPAVRWLVAALLLPLIAALFAMLFVFLLVAMRRGVALRSRQAAVMLLAAAVVVLLLLPLGGLLGQLTARVSDWVLAVPVGAAFRGLLIGVAVLTAAYAARILLAVGSLDD